MNINHLLKILNESYETLAFTLLLFESDLTVSDKQKIINLRLEIEKELKEFEKSEKNNKIRVTFKEDGEERYINYIMTKAALLRQKMKPVFTSTKQGATEEEIQTLKLWDTTEKALTKLQNYMGVNNNKFFKRAEEETDPKLENGKKAFPIVSWREVANKIQKKNSNSLEEYNYFNY